MGKAGRTGVVVPVPAADVVLSAVAERYPGVVRDGVPAHVSLLYPFLTADAVDERVTTALSELFAERSTMAVSFDECHRSGGFVYLHPAPVDDLVELVRETCRRWPELLPYEGVYGDVEPHLTVAMRADEDTASAIEREVAEMLPISEELREAWLVAFDGQWTLRARFPFGRGPASSGAV